MQQRSKSLRGLKDQLSLQSPAIAYLVADNAFDMTELQARQKTYVPFAKLPIGMRTEAEWEAALMQSAIKVYVRVHAVASGRVAPILSSSSVPRMGDFHDGAVIMLYQLGYGVVHIVGSDVMIGYLNHNGVWEGRKLVEGNGDGVTTIGLLDSSEGKKRLRLTNADIAAQDVWGKPDALFQRIANGNVTMREGEVFPYQVDRVGEEEEEEGGLPAEFASIVNYLNDFSQAIWLVGNELTIGGPVQIITDALISEVVPSSVVTGFPRIRQFTAYVNTRKKLQDLRVARRLREVAQQSVAREADRLTREQAQVAQKKRISIDALVTDIDNSRRWKAGEFDK